MKKKILYGIIAIIILLGIIMYFIHGLNTGSKFGEYTKLSLYMESGINLDEIKPIVSESFNGKNAVYQAVEYFGQMVLITLPAVSSEEIDNFVTKINEKYSLEYTTDDLNVLSMPGQGLFEILKPYIIPLLILLAISVVYFAVRYRKLGFTKMLIKPLIVVVVCIAFVVSIYLIGNFPLDKGAISISLIALAAGLIYTTIDNNCELEKLQKEEE